MNGDVVLRLATSAYYGFSLVGDISRVCGLIRIAKKIYNVSQNSEFRRALRIIKRCLKVQIYYSLRDGQTLLRTLIGSKLIRASVVVCVFSWTATWLSTDRPTNQKELAGLLWENAESIAIASAAAVFLLEGSDRRKAKHYEAWQVISSALGQVADGGRAQALEDLNRDRVDLEGVAAPNADLSRVRLERAKLDRANFEGTQLDGADLRRANLRGANLRGANLRSAEMNGADLNGADLSGADLSNAKLNDAYLENAILHNTDFSFADLRYAQLGGAELDGAELRHASVEETQFNSGKGLPEGTKRWCRELGAKFDYRWEDGDS